ncbi:hypothetical protein [Salinicoccus albus]|uniref:hypothetical protein n=1 Tax=Salinicoccus albus TaxID=418756 RepID=UPI0003820E9E|nr:hypothetical protein [Salinicoccus albus]
MEMFGVFAGIAIIGILLILFFLLLGLIKWLLQGFFLFRTAEKKNLHLPFMGFIPFGTFYLGGQMYGGHVISKDQFNPRHIGLVFAIAGLVIYFLGLSIGDVAISYILIESIAFIGIFKAYTKNTVVAILLALLNVITVGIAAIIILFLYSRSIDDEAAETVGAPLTQRDFEKPYEDMAQSYTEERNTDVSQSETGSEESNTDTTQSQSDSEESNDDSRQ